MMVVKRLPPPLKLTADELKCVQLSNGTTATNAYHKHKDSNGYLLHLSSHPSHVKNSIPFSQLS